MVESRLISVLLWLCSSRWLAETLFHAVYYFLHFFLFSISFTSHSQVILTPSETEFIFYCGVLFFSFFLSFFLFSYFSWELFIQDVWGSLPRNQTGTKRYSKQYRMMGKVSIKVWCNCPINIQFVDNQAFFVIIIIFYVN